ncbi:MAG: rubredoxin-like domain-containing protein [Desulfovermiculus sp.]
MTIWKCSECGHTLDQAVPPETCPSCKKKCGFVDASCYTPDCGGPDSGNVNPDIAKTPKK